MDKSFCELIKQIRKEKGYSQEEIAKHLNMSRLTYIQIEKGHREPTLSELNSLSEKFEVPVGYLIGERKEAKLKARIQDKPEKLPPSQKPPSPEKFKETFLYMLEKVGAKPNVGETVLYKLLYFIDFDYYEKYHTSITGMHYIKNHHGPTPVEFKKYIDQLEHDQLIEKMQSKYFKYNQKKYLPIKSVELQYLSARELQHIDEVLARLSDKSAKELSDYSHKDVPWAVHEPGEEIKYQSVMYRSDEYSVAEYEDEL